MGPVKSPTMYLKESFLSNLNYLLKTKNNIKILFLSAKVAIHFVPRKVILSKCCEQSNEVEISIKLT